MSGACALIDAAVAYGAERFVSGVHDDSSWPHRASYRKQDDEKLFLEFLHYLVLFDQLLLDQSSGCISNELTSLADRLGREGLLKERPLEVESSFAPEHNPNRVRTQFCAFLAALVSSDENAKKKISTVKVPWSYYQNNHHDRCSLTKTAFDVGLSADLIPFALFSWRGIVYGGIAHYAAKERRTPFSYVAAPGRIAALRAILSPDDIERYEWPREAWRSLLSEMPSLPERGYDFSFLRTLPAIDVSPLSEIALESTPQDALDFVCDWRQKRTASALREDWAGILFSMSESNLVGTTNIQIVKNSTIHGNLGQTIVGRPQH